MFLRLMSRLVTVTGPDCRDTEPGKKITSSDVRGFAVKSHLEVERLSERTQFASLTGSPPSSLISFMSFLQFKTLRVEEYRLALRNLEQHYQDFLRDSQDSQMFGAEDRMQVESNYNRANHHYHTMVSSAEQGDGFPLFPEQTTRGEAEADQAVFDRLQDELRRATAISDKMTRIHSERDTEVDHYRQLVSGLLERWQALFTQMDLRLRELDLLGRRMRSYRESYESLIRWLGEARQRQEKIQSVPIGDGKALGDQLAEEKVENLTN
ncbi:hypothetical protein XENOCAPTIV_009762 [Xenoophorus captivus]|uniref:Desmoplakin spectrin-like domain-containing protein n=1 Tax=Xenoophorus captivus TaxID=1517983 RepID=A0ABV0SH37_9TELE